MCNKVCESRVLDSLKYLDVWVCLTAAGLCLKRPITYVHIYMVWYSGFQAYLVVWLTRLHGGRAKRMRVVNNWQRKGIDNAESITARTSHALKHATTTSPLFIIIWLWIFYVCSAKATQLSTTIHMKHTRWAGIKYRVVARISSSIFVYGCVCYSQGVTRFIGNVYQWCPTLG